MQEPHRTPLDRPEPPVDPSDELVDRRSEVLVLLDVLARWDGNLDEHDFADPLWVLLEKHFESVQLLRHSLDVVETVDSDDDLDTFESSLEICDALDHRVHLEALQQFTVISWCYEGRRVDLHR